jgi:hypothetical protein
MLLERTTSCWSSQEATARPSQLLERTGERLLMVANNVEDTRMHGRVISNVLTN